MSGPRIVATPDGPELRTPADRAEFEASVLGRVIEACPGLTGTRLATELLRMRAALVQVVAMHARGEGFRPEPSPGGPVFTWLSATDVAQRFGMTRQSVTRACRKGRFPGAHHVAGMGWVIPLDDVEDDDDDAAGRGSGDAA